MRIGLLISLLLASLLSSGQTGGINGTLIDPTESLAYRSVTIRLMKDSVEVAITSVGKDGHFDFQSIPVGVYQLRLNSIGQREELRDNLSISSQEVLQISVQYPGPCLFDYPRHYQPRCPENHTDNIVKMVYGLPNKKTMQKARKGKIQLAGCLITGCDPAYYCQQHQRVF